MTIWKSVMLVAIAAGSASICAQEQPGPYVGVQAGSTNFDIDALDYKTDKFGWGAFVGWQFNPYFGLEAGYLSTKKITEDLVDPPVTLSVKPSAITGSLIGTYPMGDAWSIHGRLGGARVKLKAAATDGETAATASDSSTELIYGAGFGVMVEGARLRLEYVRVDGDGVKSSTISLGIVWFIRSNR